MIYEKDLTIEQNREKLMNYNELVNDIENLRDENRRLESSFIHKVL